MAKPSQKKTSHTPAGEPPFELAWRWFDHRWLIRCGAILALVTALGYAGASWGMLFYRLIVDGGIGLVWVAAGMGLGLAMFGSRQSPGPLRYVTATGLGLGLLGLATLLAGLLGVLNFWVAWGFLLVGIALLISRGVRNWRSSTAAASSSAPDSSSPKSRWRLLIEMPAGWNVLYLAATPFLGLALVDATVPPGLLWQDEPAGYDVAEYHLQVPREWYEAGKITGLKHNAFSYMPMNAEVHDLLAMHLRGGPYAGMYLAQFMHVGWMVLAVIAAGATAKAIAARQLTAAAPWATPLAVTAFAAVPWTTLLAPIAYNEGTLLFFGTLAIGHSLLARNRRSWLIAGIFAGLACGTKLTAVPMLMLAIPIVVAAVSWWNRGTDARRNGAACTIPIILVAAVFTFSPWLIRNLLWTGNPVFPEATAVLGKGHFDDTQVMRWRQAHSAPQAMGSVPARLAAVGTRIAADWRFGYLLIPLAAAAAIMRRNRTVAVLTGLLLVQLLIWIFLTHLQGRFFTLLVPIAAILIGCVTHRLWPSIAACVILLMAVITLSALHDRHARLLQPLAENNILGTESLGWLTPEAVAKMPADRPLWLVGDAQAFWYSHIPMSRLRYRTVFDVPKAADNGAIESWTAGFGDRDNDRPVILVFPGELRRFQSTYFGVPVPESLIKDRSAPFVLGP